jgi:hypothetical protein
MVDFVAKVRALISALPAQLALVQALLVSLGVVVPLLPVAWQAKAGAVLVAVAGWVAAAVRVVSRVTPVPFGAQGLTMPVGKVLDVDLSRTDGTKISGISTTS